MKFFHVRLFFWLGATPGLFYFVKEMLKYLTFQGIRHIFVSSKTTKSNDMKKQITKQNTVKIEALKKLNACEWVGNTTHDTLDACLAAINLNSDNSGWHKPTAIKANGLEGFYMLNQNGSIFCESRVIEQNDKFKIEHLTMAGWNKYESLLDEMMDFN